AILGHSHHAITEAAQFQVANFVHGQINVAFQKPYIDLVQSLIPLMPHPSPDTYLPWKSGAEAVDAAANLARQVN
ncbi:MAG: hypothetical protein Q9198_003981, partial [Flavoplaca austrocitrina]